jgi:hypothetical protein
VGGGAFAVTSWLVGLNAGSSGEGQSAAVQNLTITAVAVPAATNQLYPGGTGDVVLTISNPNAYPVTITGVNLPTNLTYAGGFTTSALSTAQGGCTTATSVVDWNFSTGTSGSAHTLTTALTVGPSGNANNPLTVTLTNDALMGQRRRRRAKTPSQCRRSPALPPREVSRPSQIRRSLTPGRVNRWIEVDQPSASATLKVALCSLALPVAFAYFTESVAASNWIGTLAAGSKGEGQSRKAITTPTANPATFSAACAASGEKAVLTWTTTGAKTTGYEVLVSATVNGAFAIDATQPVGTALTVTETYTASSNGNKFYRLEAKSANWAFPGTTITNARQASVAGTNGGFLTMASSGTSCVATP